MTPTAAGGHRPRPTARRPRARRPPVWPWAVGGSSVWPRSPSWCARCAPVGPRVGPGGRRLSYPRAWCACAGPPPTSRAGPGGVRARASPTSTSDGGRLPEEDVAAGARPGDPAGLAGRLDHAVPERPPAGGGHRRRRPAAVPVPPGVAPPARRGEVRPDAAVRQGAGEGPRAGARRPGREGMPLERPARPPSGCSTSATSGSATTSTPTSTARSGHHARAAAREAHQDRLVFTFVGKSGVDHHIEIDDATVIEAIESCDGGGAGRPAADGLQERPVLALDPPRPGQRLRAGDDRPGGHGQGLPHLARHRARRRGTGRDPPSRGRPRPRGSGRSPGR